MALADGDPAVLDDVFSFLIYNELKDHWRASGRPSNAQPGMICSDEDDEKLYHQTAAGENQIMQVGITSMNDLIQTSLADPGADRIVFWDDGATQFAFLTATEGIQISTTNLLLDINGLAADATPDGAADYVVTYDADAGTHKKVLLNNLP